MPHSSTEFAGQTLWYKVTSHCSLRFQRAVSPKGIWTSRSLEAPSTGKRIDVIPLTDFLGQTHVGFSVRSTDKFETFKGHLQLQCQSHSERMMSPVSEQACPKSPSSPHSLPGPLIFSSISLVLLSTQPWPCLRRACLGGPSFSAQIHLFSCQTRLLPGSTLVTEILCIKWETQAVCCSGRNVRTRPLLKLGELYQEGKSEILALTPLSENMHMKTFLLWNTKGVEMDH